MFDTPPVTQASRRAFRAARFLVVVLVAAQSIAACVPSLADAVPEDWRRISLAQRLGSVALPPALVADGGLAQSGYVVSIEGDLVLSGFDTSRRGIHDGILVLKVRDTPDEMKAWEDWVERTFGDDAATQEWLDLSVGRAWHGQGAVGEHYVVRSPVGATLALMFLSTQPNLGRNRTIVESLQFAPPGQA